MKIHMREVSVLLSINLAPAATATQIKEIGGKFLLPSRPHPAVELWHDAHRHIHREAKKRDAEYHVLRTTATSSTLSLFERADNTGASNGSPFNETAFDTAARLACAKALSNRSEVVNPTGLAACYNIAFWNSTSGVFEVDVRLYRMSPPFGEFTNTSISEYSMFVNIPQATLSSPQVTLPGGMVQAQMGANGTASTVNMLEGFQSVGQLSTALSWSKLSEQDLRVLMIPNITMAAPGSSGQHFISTTLSSDTVSYLVGKLVQPNGTPTNITLPEANTLSTAILASATKFVLPGTSIKVSPIGLIITCIWSGILIGVVGLGTLGRYKFRQAYRRRIQMSAAAMKSGFETF